MLFQPVKIYYTSDIASWCGISGLVNIMSSSRTLYIGGKKVEGDLVIPNSVKSISRYAFGGCTGLTSVTIGNSVSSIGDGVFSGCKGLTSVTIGDGVTSIGYGAFEGCTGLTNVTIGNGVTSIEVWAFDSCNSLKYNEYDNAYYLGNNTNKYVALIKAKSKDVTDCKINNRCKIIYYKAFEGCRGLISVTIGNGVTNIGRSAFEGCTGLTSVTIPDGVKSIFRTFSPLRLLY